MKLAALFALVTTMTAAGTFYGLTAGRGDHRAQPLELLASRTPLTPTAAEFGRALMGTANQFTADAQIANPHCVQAAPGRYMCAFTIVKGGARECHIMQGRYTPDTASTITVTLAGRAGRCDSVRDAIQTLQ